MPIEMEINSREPRYNCFLKKVFFFYFSLSASLSFSFKCLFFKRILLPGMTSKPLPLPNTALVQMSLYLFNTTSSFFPFFPGFNTRNYSNLTSTTIESYRVLTFKTSLGNVTAVKLLGLRPPVQMI